MDSPAHVLKRYINMYTYPQTNNVLNELPMDLGHGNKIKSLSDISKLLNLSMRAGGVYFFYWHVFLMNIINYASAKILQNLCEVGRIVNT